MRFEGGKARARARRGRRRRVTRPRHTATPLCAPKARAAPRAPLGPPTRLAEMHGLEARLVKRAGGRQRPARARRGRRRRHTGLRHTATTPPCAPKARAAARAPLGPPTRLAEMHDLEARLVKRAGGGHRPARKRRGRRRRDTASATRRDVRGSRQAPRTRWARAHADPLTVF